MRKAYLTVETIKVGKTWFGIRGDTDRFNVYRLHRTEWRLVGEYETYSAACAAVLGAIAVAMNSDDTLEDYGVIQNVH